MMKHFNPLGKFFRKYWFNLLSLTVALIAATLAFQANRIAEESSKLTKEFNEFSRQSQIEIFASEAVMAIDIKSCFDSKANLYVLRYETGRTFGIGNQGGKLVSLMDVRFWDGKNFYNSEKELIKERSTGMTGYVDIAPGQAQEIDLTARYLSSDDREYATKQKAQEALLSAKSREDGYWEFSFSDGSASKKEFELGWLSPDLQGINFDVNCETLRP